jgi:uncharacterized protein
MHNALPFSEERQSRDEHFGMTMTDSPDNDNRGATGSAVAEMRTLAQQGSKGRTRRLIVLVLVVATLVDWTRAPEQQISVPLYEALVIRGYRTVVRPLTSLVTRCRFKPSCSQYSSEAVRKYGLPKGIWLTLKRFGRDMPWVPFGTSDPVP